MCFFAHVSMFVCVCVQGKIAWVWVGRECVMRKLSAMTNWREGCSASAWMATGETGSLPVQVQT